MVKRMPREIEDDAEPGEDAIVLPRLRTFWIVWRNEEIDSIEKVTLEAHDVQIYKSGILVFRAWKRNDAVGIAAGLPPVIGYVVKGFRNHITFGEVVLEGRVN